MAAELSRYWWMLALRGVFAIIFGVLALLMPGLALATLVLLFGAYSVVDGVGAIITGFNSRASNSHWWVTLLEGVAGVIIGILTFIWPGVTALTLLYLIAAWAIITGVFEIYAAIQLRKQIENELWLGLSGLLSIVFGIILIVSPGTGALAVITIIAAYAIIFGIVMIVLAFRLKDFQGTGSSTGAHSPA